MPSSARVNTDGYQYINPVNFREVPVSQKTGHSILPTMSATLTVIFKILSPVDIAVTAQRINH